jgi:LysM repeat protein
VDAGPGLTGPRFHFGDTVVHPVAMRTPTRCILSVLAAGVLAAQPLRAQEATPPRTHTVKPGDTLWDLAKQYLGDAFLWPEIYRLNRDVVEDPHWIYPGEVLRLVAEEATVATTPPTGEVPSSQLVTAQPSVPTTVFSPSAARVVVNTPQFAATVPVTETPTVRPGEVMTAPFVDREGGPKGFGRILKSGDIPGIVEMTDRAEFQPYDKIFIAPPVGDVAPEGVQYLSYRLGPIIEHQGQVIVPTGVVEVMQAPRGGTAAVAKVVRVFNEVSATDRLIRLDTAGAATTTRPRAIANGPATKITWIYGEPVLPSVGSFIVLATSSNDGVRMGDEFLIFKSKTRGDVGQLGDPEIPIGRAQVVRATPFGVTAVVLGQEQPAIKEGMQARVSARMP